MKIIQNSPKNTEKILNVSKKIWVGHKKVGSVGFPETRHFLARLHEVQKSYCSHPGRTRSRSRSTLLKFSRSLYLGNHSSESIHTWTIGTQ